MHRGIVAFNRAPAGREKVTDPVPAPVGCAYVALSKQLHDGDWPRAGLAGYATGGAEYTQDVAALAVWVRSVSRPDSVDHELIALTGCHLSGSVHPATIEPRAAGGRG